MCALFSKDDKPETGAPGSGHEAADGKDWFLPGDTREYLRKVFEKLDNPVEIEVFTRKGENDEYSDFIRKFLRDMARLTDKIRPTFEEVDSDLARRRAVDSAPTIVVQPDDYSIRFLGAPAGEEAKTLVETILLVSTGRSGLAEPSRKVLEELEEKRQVTVFVSPTCPYCPGQVMNGVRAAIERPDMVQFRFVEIGEMRDLADGYNVGSVPHTVINGDFTAMGQQPEGRFVVELVTLKPADQWLAEHDVSAAPAEERDVVIVGGGPAGLSAAVYVVRSGLSAVVLEGGNLGGQVAVTPVVENYPGFVSITGGALVETLVEHARKYAHVHEFEKVSEIKLGRRIEVYTDKALYRCRAVIMAMGATWKALDVPGESRLAGRGISYCASCDGYLYKGRKVFVVGGGNTALTDALHLKNLGVDVSIIHRRDSLRAEDHLQRGAEREGISILWNTVVTEVLGETSVRALKVRDVSSGQERELAADALFVAIGHEANSELARELGVTTDADGFISVGRDMRTNIPRVYAAGDITGGVRQIVTATGQGATAALTVFDDLVRREASVPGETPLTAQPGAERSS